MNFIADTARVIGDVKLGKSSSVWFSAVIRADSAPVTIGDYSNVQDSCVIHVSHGKGVKVGDYVTIGHGAVLHTCDVGNNVLIGMNATVLHNAKIGDNCIIAAGSVVPPGMEVPPGSMVMGVPGKVTRTITDKEKKTIHENAELYTRISKDYLAKKFKHREQQL
ncbi:MAG: gamma carbonic anhydrase family protein [Candidatus Diapherotrites archaeon]|nr:gamma carbonic anhydrase family protein [Candidatus Diapherotrites archaeon]